MSEKHPEYDITVLVRDADKGAKISQAYPKVRVVQGELDSAVVEEEAQNADVVVSKFTITTLTSGCLSL